MYEADDALYPTIPTHSPSIITANIFTWMKQIFVAMSTVLIFETFYWSNIIV